MRSLRIAPDGISIVDVTLEEIKSEFDQRFQIIALKGDGAMIADDKGMLKKKKRNDLASYISARHIYGAAYIVGKDGDKFDDVPELFFVWLGN